MHALNTHAFACASDVYAYIETKEALFTMWPLDISRKIESVLWKLSSLDLCVRESRASERVRFDVVDAEIHSNDFMTMANDIILNQTKVDYKTVMSPFH